MVGSLAGETAKLIAESGPEPVWGPRTLSERERELIGATYSVDLAASLVLADLAGVADNMNSGH